MKDKQQGRRQALIFAIATMALVGVYDVTVGLWMLLAAEPWLAHGPGTLWVAQAAWLQAQTEGQALLLASLFQRMGAFSLFAGMTSLFVSRNFRNQPRELVRFMLLYMVAGLGFAFTDGTFFTGTTYYWVKQAIGAAWFIAAVWLWFTQRQVGDHPPQRAVQED